MIVLGILLTFLIVFLILNNRASEKTKRQGEFDAKIFLAEKENDHEQS